MGRVSARIEVVGALGDVERRWYDTDRWPQFIDGCRRVVRVDGPWPGVPAEVEWESFPAGRGVVIEDVVRHEPSVGQQVRVRDASMEGTQSVGFEQRDERVAVTLVLQYRLPGNPVSRFLVGLFVWFALRDALARTLRRFADLEGGPPPA